MDTGLTTSSARDPFPRGLTCEVAAGPDAGRSIAISVTAVVIGADTSCDLVLTDGAVSRRHVELRRELRGVRVRDLDSTNGTYYLETKIHDAVVPANASLRLGGTKLRLVAVAPPAVKPSARRSFGGVIGESAAMRELFAVLELASPTEATILVEGESGTGKELVARAIHDHSPRAARPFVVLDCSALAETLVESELFGHCEGAFTGAVRARRGAFVEADGGTLFIDEIGELPRPIQAKLLRALEARTIKPLGDDRERKVDVRIVAATNRDLAAMVDRDQFRFDLYHRLSVVHLRVPALRERPEDVAPLVDHFCRQRDGARVEVGGASLRRLEAYGWPGNVRELRNVIERAFVLSPGFDGTLDSLAISLGEVARNETMGRDVELSLRDAREKWLAPVEARYLRELLAAHAGNILRAAQVAGVSRKTLRELLKKYGLYSDDHGDDE